MGLGSDSVPSKSENVVSRRIEKEYILVPLVSSSEEVDSIFNLNEVGAAVWEKIDGKKTVGEIMAQLLEEYDVEPRTVEGDVLAFIGELIEARLIVES